MVMNIILCLYKDGNEINFERFSAKRLSSVLNQYRKAYDDGKCSGLMRLFFRDYQEAEQIVIYSTPDHYHKGPILAKYTSSEFFKTIGSNPA